MCIWFYKPQQNNIYLGINKIFLIMENKIENLNINAKSVMFNGKFHFLNNDDFKKLCVKLLHSDSDSDTNIIKIGLNVYINFNGDLSDLGNDIGLNIGKYIDNSKLGYEKDDFISGLNHGISIVDGTHG
jgi:hypothetical protein